VRLLPKSLGDLERVDIEILPPGHLIAGLMQLPVMTTAGGAVNSSLTFIPSALGWAKRR
jgi:hypothetical protein